VNVIPLKLSFYLTIIECRLYLVSRSQTALFGTSLVEQASSSTLRVPYQSGTSLSPVFFHLHASDSGRVVDISHGVFLSRLKTFLFSKSFPPFPLLSLISWNLTTRCLAVTGGGSVGQCDRLMQPNWHFGAL